MDLSRLVDRRALTVAFDSAVRDRRIDEDRLRLRLISLKDRTRAFLGADSLLEVLEGVEVERGGHSFLERQFLRLLHDSGLPRPLTQQVLGRTGRRLIRVDFRFPQTNVVVEVLGYRYHRSREQMSIDAARLNALIADGFRPYQFTFEQVVEHPELAIRTIGAALNV
jgi:very-short-patch-repair endonuclease